MSPCAPVGLGCQHPATFTFARTTVAWMSSMFSPFPSIIFISLSSLSNTRCLLRIDVLDEALPGASQTGIGSCLYLIPIFTVKGSSSDSDPFRGS